MNSYIHGNLLDKQDILIMEFQQCGIMRTYEAGETLFCQGECPAEIFLLASGCIEQSFVNREGKRVIYSLNMGICILGMLQMEGVPSPVSISCLTDATFFVVKRNQLSTFSPACLAALVNYTIRETALLQRHLRTTTLSDSREKLGIIYEEYRRVSQSVPTCRNFSLTQWIIAELLGKSRTQVYNIIRKTDCRGRNE